MKSALEEDTVEDNFTRQCVVGRERCDEALLVRFVLAPDFRVTPDIHRKLPGRGVWVMAHRERVTKAVQSRAFARGFKQAVIAGPDLPDQVAQLLRQAALQALAMANKAGLVASGFDKVEALAHKGRAAGLIHAVEAAPDGRRKLAGSMGRGLGMTASEAAMLRPAIGVFGAAELGAALGRDEATHLALVTGGATDKFLAAARRLATYDAPAGNTDGRSQQDDE